MKTILPLLLALLGTPLGAGAQTAVDATALPQQEADKALDAYEVALTADERKLVLEYLANAGGEQTAKVEAFRRDLTDVDSDVLLSGFFTLGDEGASTVIFSKFKNHRDPLLRLVANLVLTMSGDSSAAKAVFDVIHSTEPTLLQKQLLKGYCLGVGIHPATDTADTIYSFLATAASKTPKLKPGDRAPDFAAKDIEGNPVELKALRGKIVLLHFWATTCGPCVATMGTLIDEMRAYLAEKVVVIGVSLDEDRAAFAAAVKRLGMPWRNVCDGGGWGGDIARAYGVNRMPFDVIIDERGIVQSNDTKAIPDLLKMQTRSD